jgi:RNA recognition motif-containing protein
MVSAKLSSRLGSVKSPSDLKDSGRRRSSGTRITIAGPPKNMVLGIINNHLSTSDKDKVKLVKGQRQATKAAATLSAVNKSGSRIQVVSRKDSPPRRTLKSSSSRRRESFGTMRSDEIDTHARKPAFARTDLKNLKFKVKQDQSELLGIDLKSVSLKRRINNDEGSAEVGYKNGELQRTVQNKKDRKRNDSDSDEPKRKSTKDKKTHRAIYKNALNDVLESKKKAKSEAESRKRVSRNKVREMREESSDESRSPSPTPAKRKKVSKKTPTKKAESESDESDSVDDRRRRPGERGKSAAKDKFEDAGDVFSPIEGYRLKVSNLNASVSESDLVDLFCAIGAIRDARLMATPGSAIITFVKRAAAMAAVTKYNGRELDKQKISVEPHRVMDLPPKQPYDWRGEYPTKKPRVRQELVGEIASTILLPALAGIQNQGAKPVVFTVKV